MVTPEAITIRNSMWGRRTWYWWGRTGEVTGSIYSDTAGDPDSGGIYTLTIFDEAPERDNALRGEDYPALVKVWDNDVDAAIYDTD